jgi:hypothetical protein
MSRTLLEVDSLGHGKALTVGTFAGAQGTGQCVQLTIGNDYTQLGPDGVSELLMTLARWLANRNTAPL